MVTTMGYNKTLSEMTDEERYNRKKSTHAFEQFSGWYQENNKIFIKK